MGSVGGREEGGRYHEGGNGSGSFLTGFLLGGLVGAGIALLRAPRTGEKTRRMIRERAVEIQDKAKQTADEARIQARQVGQQLSESAKRVQQKAQETAEEARAEAEQVREQVAESAKHVQQTAQEQVEEVAEEAGPETRQAGQAMTGTEP